MRTRGSDGNSMPRQLSEQEQIARELAAAARASQRAADVKQRRRDVAQRRQLRRAVKRKKSIVPAQNDVVVDDDVVEETAHGSEVPPPVTRGKNHQFFSDEIIAELARQCVVLSFFVSFFRCVC
jgi:hypothetical protein